MNSSRTRTDNLKKCIKCKNRKAGRDFIDSKGWTCNDCFKHQKEIIELNEGDEFYYISDISKNASEKMIVTKKACKFGTRWYIEARPENVIGSSRILVSYCYLSHEKAN